MIHVYTGDGKGKTTAAAGLALRALSAGWKVGWSSFFKSAPPTGEVKFLQRQPQVTIITSGTGNWLRPGEISGEDRAEAHRGWDKSAEIIRNRSVRLLVLDEINLAFYFKLIPLKKALTLFQEAGAEIEIICTGRNAPASLIGRADYVTEMKEIKHPYRQGISARAGIEY